MTTFVLDTDMLSLLQRGNRSVAAHLDRREPHEVATTIISVEEQLSDVGTRWRMDLRIAAITISHDATLVTRNLSDFKGIEGLVAVDWSRD